MLLIDVDFNGWWTCVIPRQVAEEIGQPLPLFLKWDDAEYGLRARAEEALVQDDRHLARAVVSDLEALYASNARTARGRCLNGPAWAHLGLPQPKGQGGLFDGK